MREFTFWLVLTIAFAIGVAFNMATVGEVFNPTGWIGGVLTVTFAAVGFYLRHKFTKR